MCFLRKNQKVSYAFPFWWNRFIYSYETFWVLRKKHRNMKQFHQKMNHIIQFHHIKQFHEPISFNEIDGSHSSHSFLVHKRRWLSLSLSLSLSLYIYIYIYICIYKEVQTRTLTFYENARGFFDIQNHIWFAYKIPRTKIT